MAGRPRHREIRRPLLACALAAAAGGVQSGRAADGLPLAPAPRLQPAILPDPWDITGRDFAGIRLPLEPATGPLGFRARRAHLWTEPGTAGGAPVRRMLLEGDVSARLGPFEIAASRASVWLQPLASDDGVETFQFFVYFDRASTPTAAAGMAVAADRLPVQGVIRAPEGVRLLADLDLYTRPEDAFLREAERALAAYLRELVHPGSAAESFVRGEDPETQAAREAQAGPTLAELEANLPPAPRSEPIFAAGGVISFAFGEPGAGRTLRVYDEGEDTVVEFDDGLVVQYSDRFNDRTLQLTALRGVVFLAPGRVAELRAGRTTFDVADVRGFYLEGDVVAEAVQRGPRGAESRYTLRTPRAYYDVREDRAVLLDAVFWTYDQRRGMPLYLRATTIRQESAGQFRAESARFTNTSFFEPHLSVGASSITLTRRDPRPSDAPDEGGWLVDATNITARAAGFPFLYFPKYVGDPTKIPLRSLGVETTSGSGTAVRTGWDVLGLFGVEEPRGLDQELLVDYYFERGPALGADLSLRRETSSGSLFAYTLPDDRGTDLLSTGAKIPRDGDTRAVLFGEFQHRLDEHWVAQFEASYFSDETVVDAFFREQARARHEFTNSARLKRTEDNTYLTLQAEGNFNDFTPNQHLLQSQGYTVDRLPEAAYYRVADDLFPGAAPGLVNYTSEYRVGYLQLNFTEPTARELGFVAPRRSREAFGVNPGESIGDRLRAEGFKERGVGRFDTRHEVSTGLDAGPVQVTPFVAGRVTAYDRDFSEFHPDADDEVRTWGAVGTRFDTEVQRVRNDVESRFFDLHRLRHIVHPRVTLWYAGTSIDQSEIPVYDDAVESIADGGALLVGLHQTFQTQRGGPGRWHTVDWLKVNAEVMAVTDDVDKESPVGRWFDYRPEYSMLGNFASLDASVQLTEALALSGMTVYDLDLQAQAQTAGGVTIQHAPTFSTWAEARYLALAETTFLSFGAAHELTPKYALSLGVTYDLKESGIQAVTTELRRRYPNFILGAALGYNDITNESSFGFSFQPVGVDTRAARLRGLGGQQEAGGAGVGR